MDKSPIDLPASERRSPRPRAADGPTLVCAECQIEFAWSDSPSLERCAPCAAIRAAFLAQFEDEV